jgi:hypothetical protein
MAIDKNGDGTSTLPDTLGTIPGALDRFGRASSVESRGQVARKEMSALFRGGAEAEAEAKMGAFDRDQGIVRKTAEAERDVARGTRMAGQELDTGLQKRGVFEAPEYKASDYAKNSATRMITAVLLGGIAKTSAMGQLKAIESMQNAEQQGLADQFDSARRQFDEQEKSRLDNNKMLKDRFDRMIDLLGKDRTAALVEAKLIEGNLGKGIIAAELRAGNYSKAYDLFQKAVDSSDRITLARVQSTAKQASGPDRRLKPGERFNEETQTIEAIPGSDIFKTQNQKFTKEYKSAGSVISSTENGLRKIEDILDPKNRKGFEANFGGYTALASRLISGDASDMRKQIDSFKSDMKAAGKQLITGDSGAIGQITEREWPILEGMIASLDPVLSIDEAERVFINIKSQFGRIIERTVDAYDTQFKGGQYYKELPLQGRSQPEEPSSTNDESQFDEAKRRRLEQLRRKRDQGTLGN